MKIPFLQVPHGADRPSRRFTRKATTSFFLGAALCLLAMATMKGEAAILSQYNFTGDSDASVDADINSVAGSFTAGAGISGNNGFVSSPTTRGNPIPGRFVGADVTATTLTSDDYFSFTLTPQTGYELDLTSLTFDWSSSNTFSRSVSIRSSLDSFTSDISTLNQNTAAGVWTAESVSLTAGAFQNLASAITFRLYVYDIAGSNTSLSIYDNVTVNGTTSAVPEPSAWMMLGLGSFLILVRSGRRFRTL